MRIKTLAAAIAAAILIVGCGAGEKPGDQDRKLRIVATTTIVGDLVGVVGGEDVEVDVLMGPGIDPHLYKASAGDVRRMSGAKAIIYNGLHLEGKMSEILAEIGERGVTTLAVAECLPEEDLLELTGFQDLHDPHVWFDVGLWSGTVDCLAEALIELDPEAAAGYRDRAGAFKEELASLDAWVEQRTAGLEAERRVLVTAHDAFSYFARAYGFEVRGLLGVSTAAEAGTSDVKDLAAYIVDRKIPAIFVETSVSPRYVEALQEAVAARGFDVVIGGTLYSDSLGDRNSPAGSYAGTVRANVETIIGALEVVEGTGQ